MVVEVILIPTLDNVELDIHCTEAFMTELEAKALQSRTCKLSLDCLIKPVLLMMVFVTAEREGDWLLHIHSVKTMVPYFFAAGHHNYARLGLAYLTAWRICQVTSCHTFRGEIM